MKRLTKTLAALVAASAVLAACQTAPVETVEANHLVKTVEFTAEDVETRTAFTEPDGVSYPVRWTANDTDVAIFPDDYARLQKAVVEPSADGRTAKFHASFALEESSSYRFYLVSPASALDESEPEMGNKVIRRPSRRTRPHRSCTPGRIPSLPSRTRSRSIPIT